MPKYKGGIGEIIDQSASAPVPAPVSAPAPEPVTVQASAESNAIKAEKNPLSFTFNEVIYKYIAFACFTAVVLLFCISSFDFIIALYDLIKIKTNDPGQFIKDTVDYESLDYIGKDPNEEPYDIYLQQTIIKYTLGLVALAVIAIAIQCGAFLSLKIYNIFNKKKDIPEKDTVLDINAEYFTIIITVGVCLLVLSAIYKKYFMKGAQNKVKNMRDNVRSIKHFIYSYLTTDEDFLNAMKNDNISKIISTIRDTLHKDDGNNCHETVCLNDEKVIKMIFTYSLYSYFKYIIPENSDGYNDIMTLFNINNITNTFQVDPSEFFYYKQSLRVNNLYPLMKDDIIGLQSNPKAFLTNEVYDDMREKLFETNLQNVMDQLNKKISNLNNLKDSRKALFTFIYQYFGFNILVLLIVFIVSWNIIAKPLSEKLKIIAEMFINYVKSLYQKQK